MINLLSENLTAAGIRPGSTCSVNGCYEYTYKSEGSYVAVAILTPEDACNIRGEKHGIILCADRSGVIHLSSTYTIMYH